MKKYVSPIISLVVGILTFGLYGAPFCTFRGISAGSAYEIIDFESQIAEVTAFSVFSVILLILAGCLVVSGIFMILQNANVIKSKSISKLNNILLITTAIISIACLICYAIIFANFFSSCTLGATSITIAAFAIVGAIANVVTLKKSK